MKNKKNIAFTAINFYLIALSPTKYKTITIKEWKLIVRKVKVETVTNLIKTHYTVHW